MSENQPVHEVPEDSVPLRAVVFAMAVLCTVASSLFVRTAWWMAVIYLVLIVSGSFLSYKFREEDPRWLKYIWWTGILLVGVNAMYEFTGPLRDEFDYVSPFVHFLCGIFAFVTFSMRTRTDLHTATGLGLLLICLSAPVAKGLPYGCCVFAYLLLGALMMYFDCVSRTLTEWLSRRITNAPEVPLYLNQKRARRLPRGNTIALLTVVPLIALAMFLYVPRADEFLDKIWAYSKTMKIEYLTDMFYKAAMPPPPQPGPKDAHAGREWFNKHESKQLPMVGKYASKLTPEEQKERLKKAAEEKRAQAKKEEELRKEREKAEKDVQEQMAQKRKESLEAKAREKAESNPTPTKNQPKLTKDGDDNVHKAEANSDPSVIPDDKKGKKPEPPKKDEKPPERQVKTKANVAADAVKAQVEGKDKSNDEPATPVSPDGKDGIAGKDGKEGKGTEGGGEKKAKTKKSKKGKKGGGEGEEGKDGTGGNKGPAEDDKEGNGGKGGESDATIGSGNILRIGDKEKLDERMVFTVKSRRLVYLRRQCFDFYTGTAWTRTPPKKKAPSVDKIRVVDGVVKKEQKKIQPRPAAKPVVRYQQPQGIVRGSQPSVFGNTSGAGIVKGSQPSVFGNTDATATKTEEPKVLRSESPQKVEQQKATAIEESSEEKQEQLKESKFARPFVFESTDRPIFKVGMADALKPESTLPTVELVQEIKVKAKSIGNVIPGGWIPQELKLGQGQKKVDVDAYGVMTSPKALDRNSEIKVKTELPIYPIDAMRQELPLSAAEDDAIRERFSQYLQLPDSTSDELFKVAETNSDPRYNWFVQAEQICNYLRDNFDYDGNRVIDGDAKDLVDDFLFNRGVGNSNDFASTFVVLTRCIGIPSRLVSGFAPGEHNAVTGEQEVRMKHQLVWAEVYVPQFGWVPFDAHPGGVLPAQKREAQYTQKEVQKQLGLEKSPFIIKWGEVITFCVASLIALVVGFIAFRVLLALYRKWRKANAGRGPEWKQYKKVSRAIKKSMKLMRAPSETPTEFLARVQSVIDERKAAGKVAPEALPDALSSFLKFYSAVYFGRQLSEMEHLKYHADQVCKVTKSVKMKDLEAQVTAKSAVRRKDEFKDDTASSAVRRRK